MTEQQSRLNLIKAHHSKRLELSSAKTVPLFLKKCGNISADRKQVPWVNLSMTVCLMSLVNAPCVLSAPDAHPWPTGPAGLVAGVPIPVFLMFLIPVRN